MSKFIVAAAVAAFCGVIGSAQAAVLNGTFSVTAVNVTNLNSAESQATRANYDAALANTLGGANSVSTSDAFTYTGDLSFGVPAAGTIGAWLGTGIGGSVSGLDGIGGLTLSSGNINNGTATTTFFLFSLPALGPSDFTVRHDDGIAIFDDGALIGGLVGPTSVKTTQVNGFNGGVFEILYVATNNNPSILNVDASPVPLPAPFALLAAALAGLGAMRLRRKAA